MAEKNLFSRLRKLFSTSVIVRNAGKKKLKIVDTSHYQSDGNPYQSKRIDRYGRIHGRKQIYGGRYNQYNSFLQNKIELYADYEAMDQDPIINSALSLYSDECTTKSETGDVLIIKSENEEVKKILHNLFYDVLNIEFNLRPWVRTLVKYGDFYLWMDIQEEYGIVNVQPLSAYEVTREEGWEETNPQGVRFIYEGGGGRGIFENYEVAHFRLLGDTNFLPYGTSIIEGCRRLFKQIQLMEDAMLIHRIMRAPEKRVFKVDVGGIPPNEVDTYMQKMIEGMKKVPYIDETTGQYNLRFNMQNLMEDFFLAVRGPENSTEITSLPGLEYNAIEDIQYLQDKLFAALKIPKAFLGFEGDVSGKATLSAQDVRFARTVEAIQRVIISELTKIGIVHLYSQGYSDEDLVNFTLELTSPSIIYEQEKIELLKNRSELARQLNELKLLSREWIYKAVFNMSKDEYEYERNEVIEDIKQNFRMTQIENEGNDPMITNESYGTPHDLATAHIQNAKRVKLNDEVGPEGGSPEGGHPGAGRPYKGLKYGTDKHNQGRDPLGGKTEKSDFRNPDLSITHKFRGNSPLSLEHLKVKQSRIIQESLTRRNVQDDNDGDTLSEDKLLSDNVL